MKNDIEGDNSLTTTSDDTMIVTVRLASGEFESTIKIPLSAPEEKKKQFIESWLALMRMGLQCA